MSVLAVIVPPLGVLLGVLVGALVEPLKLRFAADARRRQLREERCADLVRNARDVRDGLREFLTVFDLKQRMATPPGKTDRGQQVMDDARKAGSALRAAASLVELSGPETLSVSARAVRDAVSRLLLDVPSSMQDFSAGLVILDECLDAFVTEARKHVN